MDFITLYTCLVLTVGAFFLIRGVPVLALYRDLDRTMKMRLALVASTQLPLVATLMNRLVERGSVRGLRTD